MTTSWNTFPWFHSSSHNCCHINRLHQDHRRVQRRLQGNNHQGHSRNQDNNSRHNSPRPCQTSQDLHQEDHFSGHLCRHRTMATASKTRHGTGGHNHRKGSKAHTTCVELEQSQPMTKMQGQLQQEESTGQHCHQHGNSRRSQRKGTLP
jgi:hypothetical protein